MSRAFRFSFDHLAELAALRLAAHLGRAPEDLAPWRFELVPEADGSLAGIITINTDREPVDPAAFEPGAGR